ncbi:3-methyl-2-oxobutanoate hydroxymethyltransferase [Bacillus mesophilus]|uniref:3-methyl-2-oxobutanoate hydroxymethyltransferase n=1 Tax=Bacillus mesophilus TaxID=1808955 RepID=A0A6M0Q829_9BACI|nr:3-methyl-2-oxobutanoate hydroxymethyltransferase [Bacillus mesophilus]MBM7661279.1 3-methyl-2-oxobutanoate hydroxymethyltransferase [Bacillus mesophilus]NEY71198.1 3-methyl-2-oxobutanoate hydroxymethyltransferase [Bacillus mesophilus]
MKQTRDFMKMKLEQKKIAMLTAYDYPTGKLAEEAGIDLILVGDSLGMVVLGYESTIPVTVEDMIHHTKAVKRGAQDTFIVTDMPFMSYHISKEDTLKNAKRIFQESGAHALKLEGAGDVVELIRLLTNAGIPVMAHLGLQPQSVGVLGGYSVQGKDAESAARLLDDAKKCEEAGAFAVVLECVPKQVAEHISLNIKIPTIGIGAGNQTDGQVLVFHDLIKLGVTRVPKFVKTYLNSNEDIKQSIAQYIAEVKTMEFPSEQHSFKMKEEELVNLYGGKS